MEPITLELITVEQVANMNTVTVEGVPEEWKTLATSTLDSYRNAAAQALSVSKEVGRAELASLPLYTLLQTGRGTSIQTNGRQIARMVMQYISSSASIEEQVVTDTAAGMADRLSQFLVEWKNNAAASLDREKNRLSSQLADQQQRLAITRAALFKAVQRKRELSRGVGSDFAVVREQLQLIEAGGFFTYSHMEGSCIFFNTTRPAVIVDGERPTLTMNTGHFTLRLNIEDGHIHIKSTSPTTPQGFCPSPYISSSARNGYGSVCYGNYEEQAFNALQDLRLFDVINATMNILTNYNHNTGPFENLEVLVIAKKAINYENRDEALLAHLQQTIPGIIWDDYKETILYYTAEGRCRR